MSKVSYAQGPSVRPFEYVSITDLIKKNVAAHPDLEIFIFRGLNGKRKTLTFRELFESAKRVAMYLISINVKKQNRVGLFGPNSFERIIAEIGILLAGATVLQLSIELQDGKDARAILDIANCNVVFVDPGENGAYKSLLYSLESEVSADVQRHRKRMFIYLQSAKTSNLNVTLHEVLSNSMDCARVLPQVYPEDDAIIFTTSGSTGKPKMVVHAHFNFICSAKAVSPTNSDFQQKEYNDRPFGWSGASPLNNAVLGVQRVFTNSSLGTKSMTISEIWKFMKDENISFAYLMPFNLYDLINDRSVLGNDGFRLKTIATSGQVIDTSYTEVVGLFCDELMILYGSTEAGKIAVRQSFKPGSLLQAGDVGPPVTGVEIRIVNEKGHPIPVGESGEIQVRSHHMMKRYYIDIEMIDSVFTTDRPEWLKTGDIGFMTFDGNLIVQGRIRDNICRGGNKILPGAIDSVIMQLPEINQVITIAVPDCRLYEEICVCYTTTSGASLPPETLRSYCDGKFIKDSSDGLEIMPKYFVKFDDFPILSTGKPNKQEIKKEAKHILGLDQEGIKKSK